MKLVERVRDRLVKSSSDFYVTTGISGDNVLGIDVDGTSYILDLDDALFFKKALENAIRRYL